MHMSSLGADAGAGRLAGGDEVDGGVSVCCYNYAQGALFIYGDDGNSIKLDVYPNFETRQTEFGKQVNPVPAIYPTYGSAFIGTPGQTTWQHQLGPSAQIGISALNAAGFTMSFDYVRVYRLKE